MTGGDADDGFLDRWSRRKATPPERPAPSGRTGGEATGTPPTAEDVADLVARLPSLESIALSRDVSAFLARGVPEALRNAALAMLWRSDPAIRDRIPDAVDYAENYHAPETIAGWGASAPGEGQAMVDRLHRGLEQVAEAAPEAGREAPSGAEPAPDRPAPAGDQHRIETVASPPAAQQAGAIGRRHGGALPADGPEAGPETA